jgi:hypothetical protein
MLDKVQKCSNSQFHQLCAALVKWHMHVVQLALHFFNTNTVALKQKSGHQPYGTKDLKFSIPGQ